MQVTRVGGGAKGQLRQINKFVKQTKSSLKSEYFWWLVILIFNKIFYPASIRFLSKSARFILKLSTQSERNSAKNQKKKYIKTMLIFVRLRIK
jgi:hypothetical protein